MDSTIFHDEYMLICVSIYSYNQFTPPHPMALSPAGRLTRLHSNPRSSHSNTLLLASPSLLLRQIIPITQSLASNQTMASR